MLSCHSAGIVLGALAGLVGLFFGALLWHQRQLQGELLWAVVPLGERSRKQGSSSIKDTEQGNSSGQGHSSCTGHLLMVSEGDLLSGRLEVAPACSAAAAAEWLSQQCLSRGPACSLPAMQLAGNGAVHNLECRTFKKCI